MNNETEAGYIKLTTHFIQVRLVDKGIKPTEKTIRQALLACSVEYRPAYWRRLRCAIVTQQTIAGFTKTAASIKLLRNPVTIPDAIAVLKAKKKPKQKRVKTVKKEEHFKLKKHLQRKKDLAVLAAIETVRILGCRPAEMMGIKMMGNNTVFITGAKKRDDGLRGLDRTLIVSEADYNTLSRARGALFDEIHHNTKNGSEHRAMHRIQHRLATATKTLWPNRKHQITLYSYRHLMGSDLKASGLKREEIAAIMGHQSVDSVDVYGSRQTSQRKPSVRATVESIKSVRKTILKNPSFISKQHNVDDHAFKVAPINRIVTP